MKNQEIKELSDSNLLDKINEEKTMLNKLKINHAVSPIENPMKISVARKLVAKLLTEQSRRAVENNKNK